MERRASDIRFFQLASDSCVPELVGGLSEERFGDALPWPLHVPELQVGSRKAELDLGSTARLAQSVERKALNLVVLGSSLTVGVLPKGVFVRA